MEIHTLRHCLEKHEQGKFYQFPDWWPSAPLIQLLRKYQPQHLDKQIVVCSNYAYGDVTEAYDDKGNLQWGIVDPETGKVHQPYSLNLSGTEFTAECQVCTDPDMLLLRLESDLKEIKEKWYDITIATDVCAIIDDFSSRKKLPESSPEFLWVNSPVTKLLDNYDLYLKSLTKKRRYKFLKLLDSLSKNTYSPRIEYNDSLLETCIELAKQRWVGDQSSVEVTVRAILFTAAMCMSGQGAGQFISCVGDGYKSVIGVVRVNNYYSLQFVLGPQSASLIAWMVKELHLNQNKEVKVDYFDPGCICSMVDSGDNYMVYKRLFVNQNCVKPLAYMTADLENVPCAKPPFFVLGNGWTLKQDTSPIFDPL